MSVGIKFVALADGQTYIRFRECPLVGEWLSFFDPDARAGIGECEFTNDIEDALRFDSFEDARDFWFQQSTIAPITALGGPERENRPLTVVSIEIDTLPD